MWHQRKFDQPERAANDLSLWLADEDNKKELIKKWRPRLAAARNKKQPAGSGLRTEHIKPFFDVLEWQFCVLFEAIERFAIPDGITRTRGIDGLLGSDGVLYRGGVIKLPRARFQLAAGAKILAIFTVNHYI